jgi:hypothetical protein
MQKGELFGVEVRAKTTEKLTTTNFGDFLLEMAVEAPPTWREEARFIWSMCVKFSVFYP